MPEVALLLISTAVVVLAGSLLTVLMRPNSLSEVVVGIGALSIVLIEVNSLVVGGVLRAYRPVPLLLGAFGMLLILAIPLLRRQGRLAATNTLQLLGGGLSDARRSALRHPAVLLLGVAVVAAYGLRAYLSVRLPNTDWDGLLYHLVGIDEWITEGRITHNTFVVWADTYPQSVELFVGWTCVYLQNTIYAGVSQLPIFLIGAASVAGLARRIGARRSHAALAGLLFLATPAVLVQFGMNLVDAAAASLGLAALFLVTGLKRAVDLDPHSRALWAWRMAATGMVAGLACAAKSSNLVLAPLFVAYVLSVQWTKTGEASDRPTERLRQWVRNGWSGPSGVLLCGVAALAVGGYWYLRTLVKYGNPLYPFAVAGLPGLGTVEEVIITYNTPPQLAGRTTMEQVALSWASDFDPSLTILYDQRLGGLGLQWMLIVLPLAVLATVVWWHNDRRGQIGLLALVVVGVAVTSPATWWARYVLVAAGAAMALSAFGLTWLIERIRVRGVRVLASLALLAVVGTSMWWTTRSLPFLVEGKADFLSLGSALDVASRDDGVALVFPWYQYRGLDQVPDEATIALVGEGAHRFNHPYFGNRYERDVVAVGPVRGPDQLGAALDRQDVRYVVLDAADPALVRAVTDDVARYRLLNRPYEQARPGPFYLFEYCESSVGSGKGERCSSG